MITRKFQSDLDRTLEQQLANCLDQQLQPGNPGEREALAQNLPSSGAGLDDVISLIDHVGQHLTTAKSRIVEEKKVVRKYVEMCTLVKGLLGNFKKMSQENDLKSKKLAKLQQAMTEQHEQLLDSRKLIASLQEELLKSMGQVDEERHQVKAAKSQIAQLKQLLRISNASETADTDARESIEEVRKPELRPVVNLPAKLESDVETVNEDASDVLLRQIDEMLAQIPVEQVPASKIAA